MNITQSILEALESLNGNKMRSGLTILGIVIGVAAVIALLAVGAGAQSRITSSMSQAGTNLLFVFKGNRELNIKNAKSLTTKDAAALADPSLAPHVEKVAPVVRDELTITYAGNTTDTTVNGVTPEDQSVQNRKIAEGDFISQENVNGQSSVAVIGPDTADKLFGAHTDIVGETIRISGQPFRIIGVLESKGGSSLGSQDDIVLVPLTTARTRLMQRKLNEVDSINIQAVDADSVTLASEEVSEILRERHHVEIGAEDFTVFNQQEMLSMASSVTGTMVTLLGGIAAISLLVGGIGVMNIMLVSVTERTREIGLRKAIGAHKRDIMMQFLTESSLLTLMGGIIGIIAGWLIAIIISKISSASGNTLTPVVRLNAVLLATIFSTAIGLFFGLYPANRAANLEPVEALRYE